MRELLPAIDRWHDEGKRVAIATVVSVWGSAPRPIGSKMAISSSGDMEGSVSGGCVESAVFEAAGGVLGTARPVLLEFGVSDERAWSVGLSCGGTIRVFCEPLTGNAAYDRIRTALASDETVGLATVVRGDDVGRQLLIEPGGESSGTLGSSAVDDRARAQASELRPGLGSALVEVSGAGDELAVFVEWLGPRRTLVIVGAVHVAVPLVSFARLLGYRTVVVDPRPAFATPERFGHADLLLAEWPEDAFAQAPLDEATAVVVLSHDLKIDVPALRLALASPASYIGALGSRKTQQKRVKALTSEGVPLEQIDRIHSPIGLDIGGRRAEEIALAIAAEITATRYGRVKPGGAAVHPVAG